MSDSPNPFTILQELANAIGGNVDDMQEIPGSGGDGFAVVSFPLPADHWLTAPGREPPPMPMRMGIHAKRYDVQDKIREAARYAIRASTMNGSVPDFDPDAMVQNFVVGMLGYHTTDGLSDNAWANPDPVPEMFAGKL